MELNSHARKAIASTISWAPWARPATWKGLKKVAVVGGGVGCAIAYPSAKKLPRAGHARWTSIVGFRNKDLVILEDEFKRRLRQPRTS